MELPEGWARWSLEPIDSTGRHSADEIMVSRGKLTAALVTKSVLKRKPGSKLRKRMLTTALRGGYGLTNRREFDRLVESIYAGDCEVAFESFFPDMGDGIYHGWEGVKRFLLSFDDALTSLVFQPREVFDPGGEFFVAAVDGTGIGRASGISVSGRFGVFYAMEEGRVRTQESFADLPSAIERLKEQVGAETD